jgi:hypothetical protein
VRHSISLRYIASRPFTDLYGTLSCALLGVMVEWVAHLLRVQEVLGLDLGPDTQTKFLSSFSQSLKENTADFHIHPSHCYLLTILSFDAIN